MVIIHMHKIKRYNAILKNAQSFIERNRPYESPQKKAAFARSVAYLCTGETAIYSGPCIRELAVIVFYAPLFQRWIYEEAIFELNTDDGLIFGPISNIHINCFITLQSFDDDPQDLYVLREFQID